MKMKSIAATGHEHLVPPGFGTHGKNAAQDQVWYRSNAQPVQHYRHLKPRKLHPFRFFIESAAVILGLSASAVLFFLLGAVLLVLAIMAPVMIDFFTR